MSNLLIVGSLNMDTVIDVKDIPRPGETVRGNEFEIFPGGKGANQAYAAAKLGANVSMIGMLGKDDNGERLLNNLKSVGVNTKGIESLDYKASGTAFISVDKNGENSIIVIPGANNELTKENIKQKIELIDRCDAIIVQLEIPIEVVTYLAGLAKKKQKTFILDPAPAIDYLPEQLIKNVDIMKPNETELETLTGMKVNNEKDVVKAARKLITQGVKHVVVTRGSKEVILVTKDKYRAFPSRKVEAVDSTAAGDAFIVALAVKLTEGESFDEAIRFANIVSSIVVSRKGAQQSIPSREEVAEVLIGSLNTNNKLILPDIQ